MLYNIDVCFTSGHCVSAHLRLEGEVTLPFATELKNALINAMEKGDVVIDCGKISQVDLAALQLLCTAHRTAVSLGKCLKISNLAPEIFQSVQGAGFQRQHACRFSSDEKNCLWIEAPAF